jgi:signal transduction histidine kinase
MGAVSEGRSTGTDHLRQIESNELYVGVQDTGPGLSPETLSRLFEPFYTTKLNGMGMGLTICRSIVESHAGHLGQRVPATRGSLSVCDPYSAAMINR